MAKKEIVVIGAGKFGKEVINKIKDLPSYNLIVIDKDEEKLRTLEGVDSFYVGDASDEKFLDDIGLDSANIFLIAIGDDIQSSILIASLLKTKYKGKIIAKGSNENHEQILRQLGVNSIINSDRAAARRAIVQIVNPFALEKIKNEIIELDGGISMVRIPADPSFHGKLIKDLGLLETTIVLVYKDNNPIIVSGITPIEEGDEIVHLGENTKILEILQEAKLNSDPTIEIKKKSLFNRNN